MAAAGARSAATARRHTRLVGDGRAQRRKIRAPGRWVSSNAAIELDRSHRRAVRRRLLRSLRGPGLVPNGLSAPPAASVSLELAVSEVRDPAGLDDAGAFEVRSVVLGIGEAAHPAPRRIAMRFITSSSCVPAPRLAQLTAAGVSGGTPRRATRRTADLLRRFWEQMRDAVGSPEGWSGGLRRFAARFDRSRATNPVTG